MSREVATFARALLGLAVVGAAFLLAFSSFATNNAGVPPLLLPFLPVAITVCVFVGGRIIRAAFRDATKPQ